MEIADRLTREWPRAVDKLLRYIARIFGCDRAGNHIQKALEQTLEGLVEARQLVILEDRVSLPN
jgi:hypothetical protein